MDACREPRELDNARTGCPGLHSGWTRLFRGADPLLRAHHWCVRFASCRQTVDGFAGPTQVKLLDTPVEEDTCLLTHDDDPQDTVSSALLSSVPRLLEAFRELIGFQPCGL